MTKARMYGSILLFLSLFCLLMSISDRRSGPGCISVSGKIALSLVKEFKFL